MKKSLIIILIAALLVSMAGYLCFAAEDQTAPDNAAEETAFIDGGVIALENDRLMIRDNANSGVEYIILLTEDTVYEGKELPEVGDRISVRYNGMMTRSLPAQITAETILCHEMTGVVSDMAEGQFLLMLPDESQFLVIYDAEMFMGVQDGMTVTVFYDGSSTRSIPPQIAATHVRTQGITGVVSALSDGAEFMITDSMGIETVVHISPATFSFVDLAGGMEVTVTTDGIATMSLPAQVNAVEILPAE